MKTTEKFIAQKNAKLMGYVIGRIVVAGLTRTMETRMSRATVATSKQLFESGVADQIFAVRSIKVGDDQAFLARFTSKETQEEYLTGYSNGVAKLELTNEQARRLGVYIPIFNDQQGVILVPLGRAG